jgi:hypothetical protein
MSGPLDTIDWRADQTQFRQAANAPLPEHPSVKVYEGLALFLAVAAVVVIVWLARRGGLRNWLDAAVNFARRRAALVICVGVALLALDWLVLGDLTERYYFWRDLHRDHWIALSAVAIALVGLYHWITLPLQAGNISD